MTSVYVFYLFLSMTLTIWVGHSLFTSGGPFLRQVFGGDAERAAAVNRLLLTGFYLVNTGLVAIELQERPALLSLQRQIELVAGKVGGTLFLLGCMHSLNLFVLCCIREWIATRGNTVQR